MPTQRELWAQAFDAFGEKISAVHMKGAVLDEQNQVVSAAYSRSVLDYKDLFRHLKELKQDFSVLREECDPNFGVQDCHFLKSFL
jgi:L-ribulose-5-phosphate 3-epimerase UlaE